MSKYETIVLPNLPLIERWRRNGASEEEVAKRLDIAYSTLREYSKKFSALSAVLKKGKEIVDTEVENALLKRALGYEYDEITKECRGGELVVTKIVRKQVVPDIAAQIFWLKNREPSYWRDNPDPTADEGQKKGDEYSADELRAALEKREIAGMDKHDEV